MYPEDAFCKTCNLNKPARSKHCSVCGICVPNFDHHCVWLNKCVTKHNYLIFLAFVLQHALICLYGAFIYYSVLLGELHKQHIMQFKSGSLEFFDQHSYWDLLYLVPKAIFDFNFDNKILGYLGMMDTCMGLSLPIFFAYHLRCAL